MDIEFMKLPDLSYLALPDGVLFQLNKKSEVARATAERMGMLAELNRDLTRPGDGINVAAAMGRDGEWMRAVIASDSPAITGFEWMEFAVSPVNDTATKWLLSLVRVMSHSHPANERFVDRPLP